LSGEYEDKLLEKTFEIAIEHFQWVQEYQSRSVTEIEIQHGALRSPHCRCFFYFRTVEYLMKLDESQRKHYIDKGVNALKLARLKKLIIDAGFKIKWFSTPDEMVEKLHAVDVGASKTYVKERSTHRIFRSFASV